MKVYLKTILAILLGFATSIAVLFITLLIFSVIIFYICLPSDEPLRRGTVLELNLSTVVSDSPRLLPFADISELSASATPSISLLSAIRALESGANDPNITALSLRMDGGQPFSLAISEELRSAIELFRERSGKPIYGYSESYTQSAYYLASVADSLFMHPLGSVEWQGVATANYYFGGALERMGLNVEAFRPEACDHKSAVEPYTRKNQSSESREQSQRLVDALWSGVVEQVATSRKISEFELRKSAAEQISIGAHSAVRSKMIDRIAYRDEYDAALERVGIIRNDEEHLRRVTLAQYASMQDTALAELAEETSSNSIAIIYVDGVIVDGLSESGTTPMVGSTTLVSQLRRAGRNDSIKAVILRVNSPGGSAMASDVMWREVELLRAKKPLIVSMGSMAASGGYYISAPADMIVANRYTLTGSIGVYGLMVGYAESLSRNLLINIDGAKSEPSADFGLVPRRTTPLEREAVMRGVNDIYDTFLSKVSSGRNLLPSTLTPLAGGRVWSGSEAVECGLADMSGGLHTALAVAIDRSSLSEGEYEVIEILEEPDGLDLLFAYLGVSMQGVMEKSALLSTLFTQFTNPLSDALEELRVVESSPRGMIMHDSERVVF